MSKRERDISENSYPNDGGKNANKNSGTTKIITFLIISAFVLGSVIASGVTFVLIKKFGLLKPDNPISSPTPTPTLTATPSETPSETPSTNPTPTPSETPLPTPTATEPSPTPTETPSINPQPTDSPSQEALQPKSFVNDMVISGDRYISFTQGNILIRGKLYSPIFRLSGDTQARRVGFKLDGSQKKLQLEFGQEDLETGNTNLTYAIKISVDGQVVYMGKSQYGQSNQMISVPLDKPQAQSLVIEYFIEQPAYNFPPLYFTKAQLLYE